MIPTCSRADLELFKWLLSKGAKLESNNEGLIRMLIGSQENRLAYLRDRISILDVIIANTDDKKKLILLDMR